MSDANNLVGQRNSFAIEFKLVQHPPPYGKVRLWADGQSAGDIEDGSYLDSFLLALLAVPVRRRFSSREEIPSSSQLDDLAPWSLGESFVRWRMHYYAIEDERCVEFAWRLSPSFYDEFPTCRRGDVVKSIGFDTFREVVEEFSRQLSPYCGGWLNQNLEYFRESIR